MNRLLMAFAVLGAAGCAGVNQGGAAPAASSAPCGGAWSNPYQYPCQPCKVAQAPKPQPPPPPPAAAPAPAPAPAPEPAATVGFDPAGGKYTSAQQVTLSSSTPGAVIHYTTDGSAPTADSPVYSGPITVSKDTEVRAIAIAPGTLPSAVATGAYTIAPPPPPARVQVKENKIELAEKVYFDSGKSTIKKQSYGLLDEAASVLKQHPEVKHVVIEGHTDNVGSAKLNTKLSKARAQAVRAYLVKKGVEASRLDAEGYGPANPIGDNKTAAGREANRRVDFMIK
ncbi:MAG TPA: OmpA family protein [Anaeromyxobacteraceae bacterium]|jgi:outer membrane protein OmpA-like peptidoglycan-associated protein|nr:OmpA family protein [Anaeromyxobacteraceae bacterium]